MRILTPTGTAVCSTSDRCTCFTSPPSGEGREVPRFTKITDPVVIAELQAIKTRMYGDR
jgi:hypothetical protein